MYELIMLYLMHFIYGKFVLYKNLEPVWMVCSPYTNYANEVMFCRQTQGRL